MGVLLPQESIKREQEVFDAERMYKAVEEFLYSLGKDPKNDPVLKETPRRVVGYWRELLEGEVYTNEEIARNNTKLFHVSSDAIVIKGIDDVFSTCSHHLAGMYDGTVYVCYLPELWDKEDESQGYKVIGLSKIPRIVKLCAHRLQTQEQLAKDIADCISIATESSMVYVRIVMNHMCVSARGSSSEGVTDVTYISPALKKEDKVREEIESKVQNLYIVDHSK